jgi:hypothetical protein
VTSGAAGWTKSGPTAQLVKSIAAARAAAPAKNHLTATPDMATELLKRADDDWPPQRHYFRFHSYWLCSPGHSAHDFAPKLARQNSYP